MPVYRKHKDRVCGLITLPAVRPQTFGRDIEEMLRRRVSFEEAIDSPDFIVMSRQRLKMYWGDVEGRIKTARLWKKPRDGAAEQPAAAAAE